MTGIAVLNRIGKERLIHEMCGILNAMRIS
jgi:hypothetical protein